MITIVDYGMGNLRSVQKAFEMVGVDALVSSKQNIIGDAQVLVLPGVGHFGAAMQNLSDLNLVPLIKNHISCGKPFLGICLGLQVLFESSEECPEVAGLGVLSGSVKRFHTSMKEFAVNDSKLRVPHMGWNQLNIKQKSSFLNDIDRDDFTYFVHSYYVCPEDSTVILSTTNYGIGFVSSVQKDNIIATQFHPEKSGAVGLNMLKNFVEMI